VKGDDRGGAQISTGKPRVHLGGHLGDSGGFHEGAAGDNQKEKKEKKEDER